MIFLLPTIFLLLPTTALYLPMNSLFHHPVHFRCHPPDHRGLLHDYLATHVHRMQSNDPFMPHSKWTAPINANNHGKYSQLSIANNRISNWKNFLLSPLTVSTHLTAKTCKNVSSLSENSLKCCFWTFKNPFKPSLKSSFKLYSNTEHIQIIAAFQNSDKLFRCDVSRYSRMICYGTLLRRYPRYSAFCTWNAHVVPRPNAQRSSNPSCNTLCNDGTLHSALRCTFC